ncbi:multicomponent Na+:H+ antiporter subunit A [Cryobacterium mesophilum]|uniref:Na+/H+ antiporter subunit A n=1 Tax=Terrimesophilobacter mesophilus TaxID=433647 RepID=A0A4R8VBK0_9MICO|nr:Na+/H+ antiporter subunit A [Terrimesophilobacter mesophilus]MBB5632596.1 multicomponent Na+:H+ antiporter subunit A [Terrimesophilobacter mesophilus]TFB79412.1 Na+/H+ antiporter subunit A [Terrimesophilobacter mesophilus]
MLAFLVVFALVPLVVPALTRRLGRRVFPVIALIPAAAFVFTLTQTPKILAGSAPTEVIPWIPQLEMSFAVRVDTLSWLLALIVTGIGALVLVYCAWYFTDAEEGLGRFASVLLAFTGTMYGLVIADDVFLLFIFWEATSVFSYLLIGHYTGRRASRVAALQALIVTTAGGLVMLVGLVMLAVPAGTSRLSDLVAMAQDGRLDLAAPLVTTAVILVLVGALSKSAIIPFHFWLPAAMAAPTPVSAYLHAAAMVQAGIYLVARLAPGFSATPGWHPLLLGLGLATMLVGGWRALRQNDLKLLLAYGTVSQLGFLIVVTGFGTRTAALAGVALLLAHALFKAALFLVVGIIDHRAGTRDLRKLSGLGREAPVLAIVGMLSVLSMAGVPFTAGFVAKEAVLAGFLGAAQGAGGAGPGSAAGWIALVGVALGSTLTVAYSARFLWGAFARKKGVEKVRPVHESVSFLAAPAILAVSGIVLAPLFRLVGDLLAGYPNRFPPDAHDYHLGLWHGFDGALLVSTFTLLAGLTLFWARTSVSTAQAKLPPIVNTSELYGRTMTGLDRLAARVTSATQRGSLPFYLSIILLTLVGTVGATLVMNRTWPAEWRLWDSPAQLVIGGIMAVAAVALTRADKRFAAALLVGVTGYGMAALFAFHGAPDLALTQVLVETVTLIAFVLVLRRLPARLGQTHGSAHRGVRAVVSVSVGLMMAAVAIVALGARTHLPISLALPDLAHDVGHGSNVVNVVLVDVRGWDTLGELSVLIAAATGVASLVFLRSRTDNLPRVPDAVRRSLRSRLRPVRETVSAEYVPGVKDPSTRNAWLLAGLKLAPENRSILLEVVIRLLFHAVVVVSVFILFAGHNSPGGGFAGGLVAGLALAGRYLAGGRYELGAAAPVDAGRLLGVGLLLAAGTAVTPLFFGAHALTSAWFDATIPVLGHIEFTTSTIFDVGVYLVVIGMVLDVLRSLGAEVDRQQEEASDELEEGSTI